MYLHVIGNPLYFINFSVVICTLFKNTRWHFYCNFNKRFTKLHACQLGVCKTCTKDKMSQLGPFRVFTRRALITCLPLFTYIISLPVSNYVGQY